MSSAGERSGGLCLEPEEKRIRWKHCWKNHWPEILKLIWKTSNHRIETGKTGNRDFSNGPAVKTKAPNGGGLCSITGQGTKAHVLQLKLQYSQIKNNLETASSS